jgi:hypothetical protein
MVSKRGDRIRRMETKLQANLVCLSARYRAAAHCTLHRRAQRRAADPRLAPEAGMSLMAEF